MGLRRNAQLFYNGSLIGQLAGIALLFLSFPYYASLGATIAIVLGALAVYSLTVNTGTTFLDVVRQLSRRSRVFIALSIVVIIGSIATTIGQLSGGAIGLLVVETYSRVALAVGVSLLLLYADYEKRTKGEHDSNKPNDTVEE